MGPWDADFWWVLEDDTLEAKVTFPQLATGENAVLERLEFLPGFIIHGMKATSNAKFLRWVTP